MPKLPRPIAWLQPSGKLALFLVYVCLHNEKLIAQDFFPVTYELFDEVERSGILDETPGDPSSCDLGGCDAASGLTSDDLGLSASGAGSTIAYAGNNNNMVGDFFNSGMLFFIPSAAGGSTDSGSITPGQVSSGAGDRILKIIENNNPFPNDRVFFNFHHFQNALRTPDGENGLSVVTATARDINLLRYSFGYERTCFNGLMSTELRIPFSAGLDSSLSLFGGSTNTATEFGNMSLAFKVLLYDDGVYAVGSGLGISFPTASDTKVFSRSGSGPALLIENQAFHLQPFLGVQISPNDRTWMIFFTQFDFDTNGNNVDVDGSQVGTFNAVGTSDGRIVQQTLMFWDFSIGYWLYRDPTGSSIISGIAPLFELHYTTTLSDANFVRGANGGGDFIGNSFNRMDILNMTGGIRLQIGSSSYLTTAAVVPLRTAKVDARTGRHEEKSFDVEIGVQFVRELY